MYTRIRIQKINHVSVKIVMPKGTVSKYINLEKKFYNAIKQRAYRKLAKCRDRSIGVVCSGGGGVEFGAIMEGIKPIWGIDANPVSESKFKLSQMCSDYNELNHGSHVIRRALQNVNIFSLQKTDIIWASLPCDRASVMNRVHGKKESDLDTILANKLILILDRLKPKIVCLENVPGWVNFEGCKLILKYLENTDYNLDYRNYNFSHYGVPQRRVRLIIRACKENINMFRIPRLVSTGWYDAISDLIHEFEAGEINPKVSEYLDSQKVDKTRYILVENVFNLNRSLYSDEDSVLWTLRANIGVDGKGYSRNKTIAMWNPEISSYQFLNSRAIARLSGFPDSYYMPEKSGYSAYICGLSVPPIFVSKVLSSFSL